MKSLSLCLPYLGNKICSSSACVCLHVLPISQLSGTKLCSLAEVDRRFRGASCFHNQGNYWYSTHFWNVGLLQWDYTALHPRNLRLSFETFAYVCIQWSKNTQISILSAKILSVCNESNVKVNEEDDNSSDAFGTRAVETGVYTFNPF
jgi:hypothetical protein